MDRDVSLETRAKLPAQVRAPDVLLMRTIMHYADARSKARRPVKPAIADRDRYAAHVAKGGGAVRPGAQPDIEAVVAIEGRLYRDGFASGSEQSLHSEAVRNPRHPESAKRDEGSQNAKASNFEILRRPRLRMTGFFYTFSG